MDDQCNWYYNTRSSPADVKQNKRSRKHHRKVQKFSNYLPFGNYANFGNYPDAEDVEIQPKSQDYLLKKKYFRKFSLVSLSIRSRSRRGALGRGALEPPPEDFCPLEPPPRDFYVFYSFKPCRRQGEQTNYQALQT